MSSTAERRDWLLARRNSIGASEAAAVLGCHPYHSALSLYYDKTTGDEPSEEQNDYQLWGHLLEPVLAAKYASVTGREVLPVPLVSQQHPDFPFITATPDRLFRAAPEQLAHIYDVDSGLWTTPITGPLELKTADRFKAGDELPVHWQVQVQQQLAVLGMRVASFAILGPFRKFYTVDVVRNEPFIDMLLQQLEIFWSHVQQRIPPPADGHVATTEAIKRLFPKDSGATVELGASFAADARELEQVKAQLKTLQGEERAIENRIKYQIGAATYGTLADGSGWSLKSTDRAGYTVEPASFRTLRRTK